MLVLKINGKDPAEWPKFSTGADMGPYLISSPDFKPSFKILSHEDEPQIPWGVVRLEIQSEDIVFNAIRPRGPSADSREVQDGYRIAQQNCFRCHNSGDEGGTKAQRPWTVLSTWATGVAGIFRGVHSRSEVEKSEGADAGISELRCGYVRRADEIFSDVSLTTGKGGKP